MPVRTARLAILVDQLDQLNSWLDGVAASFGLDGRVAYGLQVAGEEIVGNVARHGLPRGDPRPVVIEIAADAAELVMTVTDEGPAFDPSAVAGRARPRDLDDAEIGGLGLVLVRHFARDIAYARRDGRNVLTVRFDRGPPAAVTES